MRFYTVDDWLAWQESLHPKAIDLGLERVARVGRRLALDFGAARVITVAGTNGKGSCVAMLEAILLAAGYHVGTYTSPHVRRYNERIRVDGRDVSDSDLCQAFARVDQAREGDSLSYFEFGTLAALSIFTARKPDVMVLEVGLGGRLDAVNIIAPDVALISSIAIDHSDWLGNDREQIGREKAGICRNGRPVVCADPDPPASVAVEARRRGALFHCLGRTFTVGVSAADSSHWHWHGRQADGRPATLHDLPSPSMPGAVQRHNAAGVIQALTLLADDLPLGRAAIVAGLRHACLPGRYQRLYCRPPGLRPCAADDPAAIPVIVDVAHNPAAARALAETLSADVCRGRTLAVIGLLADKDIASFVTELAGVIDHWYVVELAVPRACPATRVAEALAAAGVPATRVTVSTDPRRAADQALQAASPGRDRLLVTGSFYTASGFLAAVDA